MGIYLSTPCSDVECEDGEGNGVKYAVAEMQGWRKNMEDAHITIQDLKSYTNSDAVQDAISVFGVFDGHGGKEVAKFTKMKYAEVLTNLDSFKAGQIETALRESFHKIDELLEDGQYDGLLKELRALPNPSDNVKDIKSSPNDDAFLKAVRGDLDFDDEEDDIEEGDSKSGNKKSKSGLAGLSTTQAVDLIRSILNNASRKPEARAAAAALEDFVDDEEAEEEINEENEVKGGSDKPIYSSELESVKMITNSSVGKREPDTSADDKSSVGNNAGKFKRDPSKKEFDDECAPAESKSSIGDSKLETDKKLSSDLSPKKRNPNLSLTIDDNDADGTVSEESVAAGGAAMDVVKCEGGGVMTVVASTSTTVSSTAGTLNPQRYENPTASYGPPAVLSGATMTCKLKDHRIPAGCTAIVAFKVGNQLYCANAGDSRGVLCRAGGVAYALSEDHKPQQSGEMDRIMKAGGFVNVVGRINGNLNLSRSLGDMKYKQLFKLSRAEQIITADPDISITTLEESDRFFILACDGIWDCLTNQQAVDFVSERLDQGMSIRDIVHDMCKRCLADDPRAATGIGSDNMTCMVVLLNQ